MRIDLTGKIYGKLTVIEEAESKGKNRHWLCKCECSKEKIIRHSTLTNNAVESCGCMRQWRKTTILVGDKFGRLMVIKEVEKKGRTRRFLCKCDCGNETTVGMSQLSRGYTKSCGCLKKERVSQSVFKDIKRQRFGMLEVVKRAEKRGDGSHTYWECLCDCGNIVVAEGLSLRRREKRSCGCDIEITNEAIIKEYKELCKKLNRPATYKDIERDKSIKASLSTIVKRFGSIYRLREIIGIISVRTTEERRFKYTKEELAKILTDLKRKYGRDLTRKEMLNEQKIGKLPHYQTIYRHFNVNRLKALWKEIDKYNDLRQ